MKKTTKQEMTALINMLRSLAPKRPLTYGESIQVARLQASRLRAWAEATDEAEIDLLWLLKQRAVPVTFVPSHTLNEDSGLTTDLINDKLQVFINESEPQVRQRFSLLHEWKHVLDFADASILHKKLGLGNEQVQSTMIEAIANEFAAQVLMPTPLVKRVWFKTQDLMLAANLFNVSQEAMNRRLEKLGLTGTAKPAPRVRFRKAGLIHLDHLSRAACAA